MKLIADYHVHSNNSKFKISSSSIEEIAKRADAMGLKEIAISDHGFKHFFATNKKKLFEARKIIDELNLSLGIKVLLGVEADILSIDGTIDVDQETLSIIDILIVGYHKMIKTDFASRFGKNKSIDNATQAFINAINRYDVDIISHPNADLNLDLFRLGKECAEKEVLIEINNRHIEFSDEQMNDLLRSGCSFVVSSDAYSLEDVGKVDDALILVEKYKIQSDRVVNVEFEQSYLSEEDEEIKRDIIKYQKLAEKYPDEQIRGTLSLETEQKLNKIAKEKGLIEEKFDRDAQIAYELMSDETKRLVEEAKRRINKK